MCIGIGIDFDNTIACYDALFPRVAAALGLMPPDVADKLGTRAILRTRTDGERAWQRLQGQVYGRFMGEARLIPGVVDFIAAARRRGNGVWVVSHKTQYGHDDETGTDLRQAALVWMEAQGLFAPALLNREQVFFEPTRTAKLRRIADLDLAVFIDDLPEVLGDPGFPGATAAYLFTRAQPSGGSWRGAGDWSALRRLLLP